MRARKARKKEKARILRAAEESAQQGDALPPAGGGHSNPSSRLSLTVVINSISFTFVAIGNDKFFPIPLDFFVKYVTQINDCTHSF